MNVLRKFDYYISVRDDTEEDSDKLRANRDLKPTPPNERTWKMYNYILVWFQSSFGVSSWNTGSSIIKATGLPYKHVIGAAVIAACFCSFMVVIAARSGADYKVGYPAIARAVFGIRFSRFFVFVRMFVAALWFGVQTYYGSRCFDIALHCIFGHKWTDIPNLLPESAQITTRLAISFFIYWLAQFPLMFLHPRQIRWFFTIKGVVMPIAAFGLFIFCMVRGHGPGDYDIGVKVVQVTSQGNEWIHCINSIIGSISAAIINQPDIAGYSKKRKDALWPQCIGYIPSIVCILLIGMAANASIRRAYGESYWSMWDLMEAILSHQWGPGTRCAVFLCSVSFALGAAGTNVFTNSIPFAADLCGILPKYFTIVRGQIFLALLAWPMVPWKMISSATTLVSFLGSYAIFVAPLLACLMADFYVVRRGNLHVPSLYTNNPNGPYYFYKGFNLWAGAAWAISPIIAIPGLYKSYHSDSLSQVASNIFYGGWIYTFIIGFTAYTVLAFIFKPPIYPPGHEDTPTTWEYMVQTNGFFENDEPINGVGYPGSEKLSDIEDASEELKTELRVITSIKSVSQN
ncbi:hypothetical protein KL906_003555 [Ogataea polymorpha]|uniref:Allantoin permease n=1 Tax=Ogataea polymorpha TaxID=460523 RepID=A0A9P8SYG5_9ASCO|nr:hypothetical protein KL906_003555 [Ogataea polymorpha]KAG7916721.1 hypothetical protein KL927_003360 [Ogataea polymorpha]KAH3659074.1 hypothetical protein OGATHE_006800 [Ogataea polymorpha]